jgi:hypothetical protein
MARMNGSRYQILGYAVWHAGKWYLRRRLPSARKLAVSGLVVAGTLTAAVVVAKRLID